MSSSLPIKDDKSVVDRKNTKIDPLFYSSSNGECESYAISSKIFNKNSIECYGINKMLNETDSFVSTEQNQLLTNKDRLWIITNTQNQRRRRKNLKDYLRKNHEIFALQNIFNLKNDEIETWENHLRQEESTLAKAEKNIAEDLALFDQFLDTCNRKANDAAARVDEELRKKDQLVHEIKRLQKTLIIYRNDQNHLTDILKQSRRYQQFLFKFAPQEWRNDILKQLQAATTIETKANNNMETSTWTSTPVEQNDMEFYTDLNRLPAEDCSLYFTEPEQLLDIFTEMEEKSLPLVEKSQYTSEILDKIRSNINNTLREQNLEVEQLQMKINQLEKSIEHETEREASCHSALIQYKNEKNDPSTEQLKQAIENLYKKYIIADDIGISTIHMLQTIENKMKSLLSIIEQMNPNAVIEAEKFREMTIQTIEHQEKLRQEKIINELKHKKALQRTSAPPYPKIGRIIMERSCPPLTINKHQAKHSVMNKREQLTRLLDS